MIDITPLDVRKKRGDLKKSMRGYETQEVDTFLDLVAERLEELVKETLTLRERTTQLQAQVDAQTGREKAVQDVLVTAQSMREEMREQTRREAEVVRREAEIEAGRVLADADRGVEERRAVLEDLERKRGRFLKALRRLLERELDVVAVEEGRTPLDDAPVDLELTGGQKRDPASGGETHGAPPVRRSGGQVRGELWLGLGKDPRAAPADPDGVPGS